MIQQYAVVDTAHRVGFYKRLQKTAIPYRSLFDGTAESSMPEIAPLLLSWNLNPEEADAPHDVQEDILRLAQSKPAVSLLRSDLTLDDLAKRLRGFHTVKLPKSEEMLLRWYDTRILPVWMDVMTHPQQLGFTDGIAEWKYYDRFGDLTDLPLPAASDELSALTPYRLDVFQYEQLLEATLADELIAHLREIIRDELKPLSQRVLYPFIQRYLEMSREHGLTAIEDHAHFALMALYTSGHFLDHPAVQERLRQKCTAYPGSFFEWSEPLLDEIAQTGAPLWCETEEPIDTDAMLG